MSTYPEAIDAKMVGEYPASTKSGGGYFYDDVLEYRVWCRPWLGAPDEFEGEIYYYAFPTYEEAKYFSENTQGTEEPLVLVRQLEWLSEILFLETTLSGMRFTQVQLSFCAFGTTTKIVSNAPNKSLKAASLDSPNRRMLRIICAACVCPLAQR